MISLRSFSRSVFRPASRIVARSSSRNYCAIPRASFARPQPIPALSRPRCAAFSTTRAALEKQGEVDQELSAKLESELQMEQEIRDSEKLPESISDFLENSPFKLHDNPGQEEVVLTRKFGDENIRISFTVADLNAGMDQEDDFGDDKALFDEPNPSDTEALSAQSGGANSKKTINQDQTSAAEEAEEEDAEAEEPSFPARINVLISKPGHGTLHLETTAQDGEIIVDQVGYFKSSELADAKTAEHDWKKRHLYVGPPFGNLDEDLQVLLERYLHERGVDTALALWVPEYIDFKEQREYLSWLSNVKKFVDA